MSEERIRAEIERAVPEVGVREILVLGAGVDSEAYLVNGEWVFRFPKREEVARALRREVKLLPKLAGRLPVATPEFGYIRRRADSGLLFAGYRFIPGEPLTPELFASLAAGDQEGLLATLANFLRAVHSFPVAEAIACGVEELDLRTWVEESWSGGREVVLPLLTPEDGRALARLIRGFHADDRNHAATPCLLYADFAPEHVLYDRAARAIAGIIDWGDLAIGEPDFDLMYLYQDYGQDFVRRLLAHYPHREPERLLGKLRVFTACDYVNTIAADGDHALSRDDARESLDALLELLRDR